MVNIERTMGKQVIEELSQRLLSDYGSGYSVQNLWLIRQFYLNYPRLVSPAKIPHALRGESSSHNKLTDTGFLYAPRRESWKPGQLNPNFSWTHYRILLRVDKPQAQAFYEIEAIKDTWSARELERQKNSLLYERLALSRDKKGFITLRDPSCCVGIVENKYGKDSALQNAGK